MAVYYNENDPYAAQWLRNLIEAGHIAPGIVDDRSIADVRASDLAGFTQHHFFAGIGVWSYALRLAGWPDDEPIWTGSCPCQPFSNAGNRRGTTDSRHLWPVWERLVRECGPATIIGEQVASKDALAWLDIVSSDLENQDYAFAAADLPVAGVGGPHWRQRLWWVANTDGGDASPARLQRGVEHGQQPQDGRACNMEHTARERHGANGLEPFAERRECPTRQTDCTPLTRLPGPVNGFWTDADWLLCTDGKWRPVEPGTQPLAYGVANRVGQLRAYGNTICPEEAKIFIEAVIDATYI